MSWLEKFLKIISVLDERSILFRGGTKFVKSSRVDRFHNQVESNSTSMVEISNRVEFRVPILGQFFDDF